MNILKKAAIVAAAAAAFAVAPAAALAQNAADPAYDAANAQYAPVEEEDDDFPWGLLGLLGLAGLLGLKRKDNDIHVDARRDTRP
ncbi:MAG TPA: WGxxGxxG family protein [Allosphingosinicella sp.]|jgi:MYXO-CTERM domain-containing protein